MIMEKLSPQTKINSLIGLTQSNYSVAISYYAQRRLAFKSFLEQNYINALNFEKDLDFMIQNVFQEEVKKILQGIYYGYQDNIPMREQLVKERFDTSPYLEQMLFAIRAGDDRAFWARMGFVFEQFIKNDAMVPIIQKETNFYSAHATQLVDAFVSGAETSLASVVKGERDIRPDIIVKLASATIEKDNEGVLREHSSQLPIEMQGELNIDYRNIAPSSNDIMNDVNFLQYFLENSNFYGFSAKLWSNSDGKHFMQSSVLQDKLNSVFNQTDSKGRRHTWEIDYTNEYVAYELSKNIFHIVGPTNIAMVTGGGLTWMDNFLQAHLFYMRVQVDNFKKAQESNRFFPQITDPKVYLRNYKMGASITALKSSLHKTKKGNYIDFRVIL